jgi:hypothetical protein
MKIHFFIEDTHLPPKISKCISSPLDHSYCKRETSLTKFINSQSMMILVVRLGQLTDILRRIFLIIKNFSNQLKEIYEKSQNGKKIHAHVYQLSVSWMTTPQEID